MHCRLILMSCLLLGEYAAANIRAAEPLPEVEAARAAVGAGAHPNVLLIAIDDLRCDLGAFGVEHAKTPALDAFAASARVFEQHFVQVPTCGASRCVLMRGRYPSVPSQVGNNGIRETQAEWAEQSLPGLFRQHGYRTLALGKITHYPGGLTGRKWAAPPEELSGVWERSWIPAGPWETPEAIMHGYANGAARKRGESPAWEAHDGPDESYPDAWVAGEAVETLGQLAEQAEPWFFGIGFFKPHLPFAAPQAWFDLHADGLPELAPAVRAKPAWPSGWHGSGEFRGNYGHPAGRDPSTDAAYAHQLRQAYAASISYMDAQVGRVLQALRESGMEQNTIVVIWSDHGFLLGEHAIWGKHCLYDAAVRSPLMIRTPDMPRAGTSTAAIVETVDVLPTLTELCGLTDPQGLDGHSLVPHLRDPSTPSQKPAHGFWSGGQRTIRNQRWRLISDRSGERIELFDYQTDPAEIQNHAERHPEVVRELLRQLEQVPQPFDR